ncbi:MAG: hypothetical protein IPP34_20210 [Bacteroidetes bacterium]|nr:hypothetical protein [Bacteroidota bacterium]
MIHLTRIEGDRYNSKYPIYLSLLLLIFFGSFDSELYAQFNFPVARKVPFDTLIYQTKLSDEYSWMSRPENEEEMLAFARLQGELTKSILDSITGTEIIEEVLENIEKSYSPDEITIKGVQDNLLYYTKEAQEKPALFKRNGYIAKEEEVLPYPLLLTVENIV